MDTFSPLVWLAPIAVGYLLGSIPFGMLATKLAGIGDIRSIGSGNIGATNVLRTGRKGLAALTLAGDLAKGVAAVLAGAWMGGTMPGLGPVAGLIGGAACVVGHMFPIWLGFRGGKGVATFIGVTLAWHWPAAALFCGLWLAIALVTRYSSLSALVASAATPVYFAIRGAGGDVWTVVFVFLFLVILVFYRHRENIERLMSGAESRIGAKD